MQIGAIWRFASAMALAATLAFVPPVFADDNDADNDGDFGDGAVADDNDGDFGDGAVADDNDADNATTEGPGNQGLPPLQVSFDVADIESFRGGVDQLRSEPFVFNIDGDNDGVGAASNPGGGFRIDCDRNTTKNEYRTCVAAAVTSFK